MKDFVRGLVSVSLSLLGSGLWGCAQLQAVATAIPTMPTIQLAALNAGAEEVIVPDVRGLDRSQVQRRLAEARLGSVDWRDEVCGRDVRRGYVCQTVPAAGSTVSVETTIRVHVQTMRPAGGASPAAASVSSPPTGQTPGARAPTPMVPPPPSSPAAPKPPQPKPPSDFF